MGLFDKFKNQSSTQKRNILLGIFAAVIFLMFVWGVAKDVSGGKIRKKKPAQQTQVLNATQRSLTMEELASQIYALNRRFEQQDMNNRQQIQQLFAQYQPQQQMVLSEDDIRRIISEERATGSLADLTGSNNADPFTDPANPQAPLAGVVGEDEEDENKNPFKTLITNQSGKDKETPEQKAKAAGKNYLPIGTTISFVSVAGMNAPTNAIVKGIGGGEMMPTLLRVRGKAILPNGNRMDLQDCVVVASGFGQMSDERAILRTEALSCISPNGQTTEVPIKGTVFGEDGKPGMRGRLVSKNGEVIAQMMKVAAFQTLGNMLVSAAANYDFKNGREKVNNGISITGSESGSSMADAIAQDAAAGLNNTFDRIAGIYEQYAQQTFPVIEVNPGRKGEIVLTQGVEIDYKGQGQQ